MLHTQPTPTLHRVAWPGVVLRFEYRVDRWGHDVSLVNSDGDEAVLEQIVCWSSVEGAPEDAAPPSPAFQDLRWEPLDPPSSEQGRSDRNPDEREMGEFQLFGQCGRQVYSAAIRCSAGQIDFDLCVRVRGGEPFQPQSTYQLPAGLITGDASPVSEALGRKLRLDVVSIPNESVATCRFGSSDRLIVATEPVPLPPRKSHTLRWRYRICWDASEE
jgi:hypothetical protein